MSGAWPPEGGAWPKPLRSPTTAGRGTIELVNPGLRSRTLTGARAGDARLAARSKKQSQQVRRGSGEACRQPRAKLVFVPTSRGRSDSFLATSDRSGQEGSWWVRRSLIKFPSPDPEFSGSSVLQLCEPGRVPRPCPGPLGFQ